MQQVSKAPKRYDIDDEVLQLPYSMHKKLRLAKSIQGINQTINAEIADAPKQSCIQKVDMEVPYQMSQTLIKYMLFYRVLTYLLCLSLILSIVSAYSEDERIILIFMNNLLTICIFVTLSLKLKFRLQHLKAMKVDRGWPFVLEAVIKFVILIPQPTIWTLAHNNYLHLAILLRSGIIIKFFISHSIYCDERAYRIIKFNGLNASEHMFFAVKSLVESLNFAQILAIYFLSAFFFTHCLYLVSLDQNDSYTYLDYFQIIMTTMPTIGYGENKAIFLSQRIVIFFTIVYSATLNSFVTLAMLSQLQMTESELSSYWLMKKIDARQHIQHLSKQYIQQSFSLIRAKTLQAPQTKHHINFSFRNQYRLRKSIYNSISYSDINNLFSYFRDRLIQMKISSLQTNNMVSVIMNSLKRYNLRNQSPNQKQ